MRYGPAVYLRMIRRAVGRLLHVVRLHSTQPLEVYLAFGSILRGAWAMATPGVFTNPSGEALRAVAPAWVWALTGIVPGALQMAAVATGSEWRRAVASVLNIGVLLYMAATFTRQGHGTMLAPVYWTAWLGQCYVAARLHCLSPLRRRQQKGAS